MKKNTCDTTSPDKSSSLDAKRCTATPKSSGVSVPTSILWLTGLSLLLLMLSACQATQRIMSVQTVILRITQHATRESVNEACHQEPGKNVDGCRYVELDHGVHIIHLLPPKDWCDMNAMDTLGHEVWHTLGNIHAPGYQTPAIRVYVPEGNDCAFYADE